MWFFKICWSVSCLIKITNKSGVLSSELSYSTRIKGSSSNWILIFIKSNTFRPEDSILFKNWLILCFKVSAFSLWSNQTYSVIEFRFGATISYPRSFNRIIRTFFSWGRMELLLIDSLSLSHWMISSKACINRDIFWKKGFLNCMSL